MVPTSSDPVAATPVITSRQQLRICNDQDKLSNVFCKCSETVISCDFSLFNEFLAKDTSFNENIDKNHPLELELYGYVFPQNTKRVCLCNTPETVHLNFTKSHFLPLDNVEVHRFDLFNLSGKVHFNGGFSENFHGDLYIANVTEIEAFHGFEFGRGRDISLQDVQNLECCSPIKATQTYEKPTLFIENSTIGLIQTRGIDDNHLWRTLIFKSTDFNNVNVEGILFDSYKGYNVAIIGGKFKNVKHHSLIFQDAQGVFMAKNSFHYKDGVHAYFFGSRSRLNDSHIFLVENSFENQVYFDLDARHIVSWYNAYDLWDSITFELLNHTSFGPNTGVAQDRTLSFKYNLVYYASLPEGSVEFGINSHVIIFDNVLGPCNCTLMNITDQTLKTTANWCHAGKVYRKDGKCSIKLDAALEQCEKHNSVDLEKSCADKHISVENLNLKSMLTKDMTKMSIDSSFVSKIVRLNYELSFHFNKPFYILISGFLFIFRLMTFISCLNPPELKNTKVF